ncbi:MAG: histidine phosphatase family protein [Elusimicrobiota bacterium]|nr:histidine phosphatase family protein [Elusimicrobiota bacterium]
MKRLYLMRHGHSPTTMEAGVSSDALRPLSDLGREDARRMASELARLGCAPGLILHSPLLRAVQTAAEMASVLKPSGGREIFAPLDNTKPAEEVEIAIAARAAAVDEVLCVGHQPQIGEVAALLAETAFEFRPATIVAVEFTPKPRVLWAMSPERSK